MPEPSHAAPRSTSAKPKPGALGAIGPAIIVASVVIGPGSILTSSKVGYQYGYSMAWVLILAGFLMVGMVVLAGRLGVTLQGTICDEIARRFGRWAAVFIGVVMFLIIAAFQSSNNIAVVTALEPMFASAAEPASAADALVTQSVAPTSVAVDSREPAKPLRWLPVFLLVGVNLLVMAALFGMRQLYSPIERMMKILVLVMIVGFAGNVVFARPSLSALAAGMIPRLPDSADWMPLLGLLATTFSVAGAFYQSYLVKEKGWTANDLSKGVFDSVVGITALCLTTMVIMVTSAAVLHGMEVELETASDVGQQLEPLFGPAAKVLFNVGLLAGALSSFLVNAMIGGTVLSDGLGLGWSMDQRWPKLFTALALLCGMGVAIAATAFDVSRVNLIIFAQALTVVGVPLLAITLLYLGLRSKDTTSTTVSRTPRWILTLACFGTVATIILAARTVVSIYEKIAG